MSSISGFSSIRLKRVLVSGYWKIGELKRDVYATAADWYAAGPWAWSLSAAW